VGSRLVPDPSNLFDYHRYAYARLNPMKYTDPTGHCANATTPNGSDSLDYDNEDCWRLANTIANMWDSTDYWQNRFTSKEVFLNHVANNGHNGPDFFQAQMDFFLNSDEGNAWLDSVPIVQRPKQDFGDSQ